METRTEIHYSIDEVKSLLDFVAPNFHPADLAQHCRRLSKDDLNRHKQASIIQNLQDYLSGVDDFFLPESLRSYFNENDSAESNSIRKVLFQEPLENVPLYVNDTLLVQFVKWRLHNGK